MSDSGFGLSSSDKGLPCNPRWVGTSPPLQLHQRTRMLRDQRTESTLGLINASNQHLGIHHELLLAFDQARAFDAPVEGK